MRELPITGYTGLTCLLGHPAKHSISPAMHNEAFHYHGLDYVYLAFDVEEDRFEQAVDGLIAMNARGWNVRCLLNGPCANAWTCCPRRPG